MDKFLTRKAESLVLPIKEAKIPCGDSENVNKETREASEDPAPPRNLSKRKRPFLFCLDDDHFSYPSSTTLTEEANQCLRQEISGVCKDIDKDDDALSTSGTKQTILPFSKTRFTKRPKKSSPISSDNHKKKAVPTFLDLGQKHFDLRACPKCHMMYAPGNEEDEKMHRSVCARLVDAATKLDTVQSSVP